MSTPVLKLISNDKRQSGMKQTNGFVLMYQSIDNQPWSDDPLCMLVAPFLIRKACYSEHTRTYGKHSVDLKIGQYVTSFLNLAKSTAVYNLYGKSKNPETAAKSAINRTLKKLSQDGFLSYSVIGRGKEAVHTHHFDELGALSV